MTKPIVLYHDNCPDGFTAAWAAWRRLGNNADYVAVNYGQPVPDIDIFRPVYIVDFSWPREAMLHWLNDHKAQITIFDHHKTAQAALVGLPNCVFDIARSGAGIAWDELHPAELRPKLIDYVEDRDLWLWRLPHSRAVSEWLFSVPRDFDNWNNAAKQLEHNFDDVVGMGEAFLRLKRERVAKVCENARMLNLGGVVVPVVNAAWDMSEIGEFLCEKYPEAPAGGYYFDRIDKRQWGFRSRGDFDVSELCKKFGGGGHKAAAGFQTEIGWLP